MIVLQVGSFHLQDRGNLMKLAGKIALITGGGTGIGRAISLSFADEGATVVINYSKSESDAAKTSREVQASGGQSSIVKADVSSDIQVRNMVSQVLEKWGRVDILVKNAGFTRFIVHSNIVAMEEQIWCSIFALKYMWVC